jgi:formylglycine-generating enzyme required for sulfatase activity
MNSRAFPDDRIRSSRKPRIVVFNLPGVTLAVMTRHGIANATFVVSNLIWAALALPVVLWPAESSAQTRSSTELVSVPGGAFTMGSATGPADEQPAHRVEVAAFSIDKTPVTNRQFAEFLNAAGPANAKKQRMYDMDDGDARIHRKGTQWVADAGFEEHPVLEASWYGARDYCLWVGKRLPTEPEWEKAARGTDGRRFPWGNAAADAKRAQYGKGWRDTIAVGSLPAGASPYGALDMSGNAWEWVSSAYTRYPYNAKDGREDPDADVERVTRGGGQDSSADQITTTYRVEGLSRGPRAGHHNIGFRCAR